LKWRYFLINDLILLIDIHLNVQNASVKHDLNKAQTKALARLEQERMVYIPAEDSAAGVAKVVYTSKK